MFYIQQFRVMIKFAYSVINGLDQHLSLNLLILMRFLLSGLGENVPILNYGSDFIWVWHLYVLNHCFLVSWTHIKVLCILHLVILLLYAYLFFHWLNFSLWFLYLIWLFIFCFFNFLFGCISFCIIFIFSFLYTTYTTKYNHSNKNKYHHCNQCNYNSIKLFILSLFLYLVNNSINFIRFIILVTMINNNFINHNQHTRVRPL